MLLKCCTQYLENCQQIWKTQQWPANLKNSAVATGLKNVSFHSNPKEGQYQRMFKLSYNHAHFMCYQGWT